MTISVLIPTYNRACYLDDCLASVMDQLQKDDELVVVDDGSTDMTAILVEKYARHAFFRYIRKDHSNAPDTRNRCLAEADNDWLLWLDSDDMLAANVLNSYRQAVRSTPQAQVLYGDLEIFGPNIPTRKRLYLDYFGKNRQLLSDLLYSNQLPHSGILVNRSLYLQYGAYDKSFASAEDYEFWTRVAGKAVFKHIGLTVGRWRWHESNLSSTSSVLARHRYFESLVVERTAQRHELRELFPDLNWSKSKQALQKCYFELARIYHQRQNFPLARKILVRLLKEIGENSASSSLLPAIYMYLGDIARSNSQESCALEQFRQALLLLQKKSRKKRLVKYQIASLFRRLGDLVHAEQWFQAAAKGCTNQHLLGGIYFHLGEIQASRGDAKGASASLSISLQYCPEHKKARDLLEHMQEKPSEKNRL